LGLFVRTEVNPESWEWFSTLAAERAVRQGPQPAV